MSLDENFILDPRQLNTEDIEAAFLKLSPEDQVIIKGMANKLVSRVAFERSPNGRTPAMFGVKGALEVLAKCGIWIIRKTIKTP
jgi:hypothetical protein